MTAVKRAGPPPRDPGLRPDPARIRDTDDLLAALNDFRDWAGRPGFRQMAIACGQLVTATTMHTALRDDRLPPLRTVLAVLRGCGATGEYEGLFAEAWERCAVLENGTTETPAAG